MKENKPIYVCGVEFHHNCPHKYGQLCLNYCGCDFKEEVKEEDSNE